MLTSHGSIAYLLTFLPSGNEHIFEYTGAVSSSRVPFRERVHIRKGGLLLYSVAVKSEVGGHAQTHRYYLMYEVR